MSFSLDLAQIENSGIIHAEGLFSGFLPKTGGLVTGDVEIDATSVDLRVYGDISTTNGVIFDAENGRIGLGIDPRYSIHVKNGQTGDIYLNDKNEAGLSKLVFLTDGGSKSGILERDLNGTLSLNSQKETFPRIAFLDKNLEPVLDIQEGKISSNRLIVEENISVSGFSLSGDSAAGREMEIGLCSTGDMEENAQRYYRYFIYGADGEEKGDVSFFVSKGIGQENYSVITGINNYSGTWPSVERETVFSRGAEEFREYEIPSRIFDAGFMRNGKNYALRISGIDNAGDIQAHNGFNIYRGRDFVGAILGVEEEEFSYEFLHDGRSELFRFDLISEESESMMTFAGTAIMALETSDITQRLDSEGDYIVGKAVESVQGAAHQYLITGNGEVILNLETGIDNFYSGEFTLYMKRAGELRQTNYPDFQGLAPLIRTMGNDATNQHGISFYLRVSGEESNCYSMMFRSNENEEEYGLISARGDGVYGNNQILLFNFSQLYASGIMAEYGQMEKAYTRNEFNDDSNGNLWYANNSQIFLQSGCLYEYGLVGRKLSAEEEASVLSNASLLDAMPNTGEIKFLFKMNAGSGDMVYDIIHGYTGKLSTTQEGFWR